MDTIERTEAISSAQVCAEANVTYRQLQRWVDLGVIIPSRVAVRGSGNPWGFSGEDTKIVRVLGRLARLGAGLTVLEPVERELRFRGSSAWTFDLLTVEPGGKVQFLRRSACLDEVMVASAWFVGLA